MYLQNTPAIDCQRFPDVLLPEMPAQGTAGGITPAIGKLLPDRVYEECGVNKTRPGLAKGLTHVIFSSPHGALLDLL
jgi:hypothetical protein